MRVLILVPKLHLGTRLSGQLHCLWLTKPGFADNGISKCNLGMRDKGGFSFAPAGALSL